MKQACSLSFIFLLIAISTFSQVDKNQLKKTSFYVGPRVSVAAADLADTHSWGLGVHTQVANRVGRATSLTGSVSYTYLFGKSHSTYDYYEPGGGGYNNHTKFKGMSDLGFTGGIRQDIDEHWSAGAEAGLCLGLSDGESASSGMGWLELMYFLGGRQASSFEQALAAFFGLCGDPQIQIGIRYSIRL